MQVLRSLRQVPRGTLLRSLQRSRQRRHAHDSHDAAHDSGAAGTDEKLGRGFYITVALVPALLALFKFTAPDGTSDQRPYLTRLIGSLDAWKTDLARREDLHTKTVEQAGRDRNLFINSPDVRAAPMRFPEELNSGSPFNVPAGHGRGNYEKALAKFEKESYDANERKLQALRDGTLKAEQPHDMSHRHLPV